ncbi:hypothetical protein GGX14DRAFT_667806, partial [Mycena pura]
LGCRPAAYNGTQVDYRAYVERRDDFLRSSRGCIALFHGGIVARIGRMVIENCEDKACVMPSEDDLDVGVRLVDMDGEASLWQEALTPQEIDLICGVYKVGTGQQNSSQAKYLSWWPQPGSFFASALHTGWWNDNCENWFQKRLEELHNGTARLHTNSEWKSDIRFNGVAGKAVKKNSVIAGEFL